MQYCARYILSTQFCASIGTRSADPRSQIVRRQWVSPATMAWDILAADIAVIDMGKLITTVLLIQRTPPLPTNSTFPGLRYCQPVAPLRPGPTSPATLVALVVEGPELA